MHSYTVWSSEPNTGATTLAANLARAHADRGKRVLAIDFSPPGDGLTAHYGLDPAPDDADNIVLHLLEDEQGAFEELIEPAEPGVDLVPTHSHLDSLSETLAQNATLAELSAPKQNYTYPTSEQLRRVLLDSTVFYEYDLIVIDAAPGVDEHVLNAVYASPHLVVPVDSSDATERVAESVDELEAEFDDANLTVLGAVRNRATSGDATAEASGPGADEGAVSLFSASIPEAPGLFADARENGCSIFELADDSAHRELEADEQDVLDAFGALAAAVSRRLEDPASSP
ncbi:ParA family protein [Halobacteria archaeon AArc-dxtr1]|nr:ParA family protein [Halobacteria archaeon AArc-dxtr1]